MYSSNCALYVTKTCIGHNTPIHTIIHLQTLMNVLREVTRVTKMLTAVILKEVSCARVKVVTMGMDSRAQVRYTCPVDQMVL